MERIESGITDVEIELDDREKARKSWLGKVGSKYLTHQRATLIDDIMKYDVEKNGKFEIDQIADIVEDLRAKRKESESKSRIIFGLIFGIIVLCSAIFGFGIAANEMTKEAKIQNGLMTSSDTGEIIGTVSVSQDTDFHSLFNFETDDAFEFLRNLEEFTIPPTATNPKYVVAKVSGFEVELNEDADLSSVILYSAAPEYILNVKQASVTFIAPDGTNGTVYDYSELLNASSNDTRRRMQMGPGVPSDYGYQLVSQSNCPGKPKVDQWYKDCLDDVPRGFQRWAQANAECAELKEEFQAKHTHVGYVMGWTSFWSRYYAPWGDKEPLHCSEGATVTWPNRWTFWFRYNPSQECADAYFGGSVAKHREYVNSYSNVCRSVYAECNCHGYGGGILEAELNCLFDMEKYCDGTKDLVSKVSVKSPAPAPARTHFGRP